MFDLTKPIITTISGDGPCKAVDLNAVPLSVLIPVIRTAMDVVHHWNNCDINAECSNSKEAMDALAAATEEIDALAVQVIPGGAQITRMDLMSADTYPIIRDGAVHRVKPADLTPLEMEALQDWLNFHGNVAKNAAENLKQHGHPLGADAR